MKLMVDKGELRLAINRAIDAVEGEWIDELRSDVISRQAAIDALRNELKCVLRKDCDRAVCKTCDLVMNEADIIEALTMAIDVLSAQPSDEYERGWKEGREALREETW